MSSPSSFLPTTIRGNDWQENGAALKVVRWPDDDDWTAAVLESFTDQVAIAALPHVHWTSGGRLDLVTIGQACRNLGAALVLDLTQSLGALPFNVNEVQPDFAAAANYKWLLGPYYNWIALCRAEVAQRIAA